MSTIIGAVTLDHDMVWEDKYKYTTVKASVSRALSGREIIQTAVEPSGRPVTLKSGGDFGFQSRATVELLYTMVQLQAEFTLQIEGASFQVRFRHESNPVAFEPVSLFQPQNQSVEWWYTGTIQMMTV